MYFIWFEDNMKDNNIIDVRDVHCDIGDYNISATCYVLKRNKEKSADNEVGLAFFGAHGNHRLDNGDMVEWSDSILDFVQVYHLLSSEKGRKILSDYNIIYKDVLDLFPLNEEQKTIAKENFRRIDEFFKLRVQYRNWCNKISNMEIEMGL